MKYSILNFQISIIIAALLLAASCNSNHKNEKQSAENAATTNLADSLIQSTGDIELDSLLRVAAVAKKDSNLVFTYLDIGDAYIKNDSKTAAKYYFKAKELSKEINYKRGYILFAYHYAKILNEEGKSDSSLLLNKEALAMSIKSGNPVDIGRSYMHLGRHYWYNDMLDSAIVYLNNANKYSAYNPANATNIKWLTFLVYNDLKRYDEARQIGEEVLSSHREANDLENVGITAFNLGITYRELGNKDRSLQLLEEALEISDKTHYNSLRMVTLITLTNAYEADDPKVKVYAEEALALAKKLNNLRNKVRSWDVLSTHYLLTKNFQKSLACADSSLVICNQKNFLEEKVKVLDHKSYVLIALGRLKEAFAILIESNDIQNKLIGDEIQERIVLAEKRYDTEKKDIQIAALQKERELMIWLSIAGGAALLLVLATFFFLWRWTIQKRKLAETRIKQFEQEKQLVATQAVLDGETQERSRLARDLHDGLGSMLTGVKMNLADVKTGVVLAPAEVERFNNAMTLLDESITEMRRVAHHLMPDSLNRAGLKPAVSDFCSTVSPKVVFDYFGDQSRLDPMLEIVIYRSIHELVNNALKHSGASQILVQIMQEPDRIAFTVQDDGCGFNPDAETSGNGLQNIRNRIASFGGNINIDTKIDEGTEINVEFQLRITN